MRVSSIARTFVIFSHFLILCIFSWGSPAVDCRVLPHVTEYEIVRPQVLNLRGKRSASAKQIYPEAQQYAIAIEGKNYTIQLEKNKVLLGKDYTATHYLENGSEVTSSNYGDHCYYQGHVQGVEESSVSVGLCSGIRGFVTVREQLYLIEPLRGSVDGEHALYRQEHLRRRKRRAACGGSNGTLYDLSPNVNMQSLRSSSKSKPITGPQRFVEMFMVVDNAEFKKFGKSIQGTKDRMLEIANHVDKLYRPLNLRVMLVGLEVWSYKDKIDVSTNPDHTLTKFLKWRQENLVQKKKHDNAQFVTGVEFDGPTVGLATKFGMCREGSGAVNEDHNRNPIGVASTIAHEMGHNLGMSHDGPYCSCGTSSTKKCVMSDTVGLVYPEVFSSCSQSELRAFLETNNPSCLLDVPHVDRLFGGPVCGNAFTEAGEQCDCGTVEECTDPCCNASTCQLVEGAQCAQGECCHNCKIKPAGSLCRESVGDCDLTEYCTGVTANCPKDSFKMNGVPCNYNLGYCYNGQCPTLQKHCTQLWGSGARVASDICFEQNVRGSKDAYCKKDRFRIQGCKPEDMKCGKIFCNGGNEFPITQQKATLTLGFRTQCNLALDSSETEDLSMVPTGTKCGHRKVCYDNACQDIHVYGTEDCSVKCNNHGVCNHERLCHCDPGWAPPYCNVKVLIHTSDWDPVVVCVAIAVAIIVPLTLITGAVFYYRNRKTHPGNNRKGPSNSGLLNPLFQDAHVKGSPRSAHLQISQPTFLESTSTQPCTAVHLKAVPSRPPPQPPKAPSTVQPSPDLTTSAQVVKNAIRSSPVPQTKPLPPTKPLPLLNMRPGGKPKPPAVPPGKPTLRQTPVQYSQVTAGSTSTTKPPFKPR